jgi:hypothetical protein
MSLGSRSWLVIALSVVAGCGGNQGKLHADGLQSGQAIFDRSCSRCHSLVRGHGADGGDLGYRTLSAAAIASFAKIMPVTPPLTNLQARLVAQYIHARAVR